MNLKIRPLWIEKKLFQLFIVINNVPYTNAKRAATSTGSRMESFSPNVAANSRKKIDGLPIVEEVKATGSKKVL